MAKLRLAGWYATILFLAFCAWMAFAGSTSSQELMLGAACAIFSAAASLLTWRAMQLSYRIHFIDALQIVRVPWYLVSRVGEITAVLFRDMFMNKRAGSYFRAVPFEGRRGGRAAMRRALAIAYTTIAPNFIVVGIDKKENWLLFHQIERSGVSRLTQRLGAKA